MTAHAKWVLIAITIATPTQIAGLWGGPTYDGCRERQREFSRTQRFIDAAVVMCIPIERLKDYPELYWP